MGKEFIVSLKNWIWERFNVWSPWCVLSGVVSVDFCVCVDWVGAVAVGDDDDDVVEVPIVIVGVVLGTVRIFAAFWHPFHCWI